MSEGSKTCGRAPTNIKQRFLALSGAVVCAAAIDWMNAAWAGADAPITSMQMQRSLVSYLAQGLTAIRDLFWPILTAAPSIPGEVYDAPARILMTGHLAILWRAAFIVAFSCCFRVPCAWQHRA